MIGTALSWFFFLINSTSVIAMLVGFYFLSTLYGRARTKVLSRSQRLLLRLRSRFDRNSY